MNDLTLFAGSTIAGFGALYVLESLLAAHDAIIHHTVLTPPPGVPALSGPSGKAVYGSGGGHTGPGCGGCSPRGPCHGTHHWYTPGINGPGPLHGRFYCYQGDPCCYLDGKDTSAG